MNRFTHALLRTPAMSLAQGLTTVDLGTPQMPLALAQHRAYRTALESLGLACLELGTDETLPDCTFVEDCAVVCGDAAMITRPGADSRMGEVAAVRDALAVHLDVGTAIEAPGTLDGGDICEAGETFFIGLSHRTNEVGAAQLTEWLARRGKRGITIDIRAIHDILHLKSGIAALDPETLVLIPSLAGHPAFAGFRRILLSEQDAYAGNCVQVNGRTLVAAGFPRAVDALVAQGHEPLVLDMSEFRKMDGGLSCLSIRY